MVTVIPKSTLHDLQKFVREVERERGFSHESVMDKCLLLGEEVEELFKAVRKAQGIKTDPNSKIGSVDHELADILIMVLSIANRCDVNFEEALISKEKKTKKDPGLKITRNQLLRRDR